MEPEIGPGVLFFGIFRFGFGCRVLWPRLYERFVASISFFVKVSCANSICVQPMQTSILDAGSPSNDQIERWEIFSLKPSQNAFANQNTLNNKLFSLDIAPTPLAAPLRFLHQHSSLAAYTAPPTDRDCSLKAGKRNRGANRKPKSLTCTQMTSGSRRATSCNKVD
jgi:hypothetical protein